MTIAEKIHTPLDLGSTIRSCTAEETLQRILPLRKKFGITRIANITGLDTLGIPVMIAIRPNAKNLSTSQGKGLTLELAKISALMESIELWHAENLPPADFSASYDELKPHQNCLNPADFCTSSLYEYTRLNEHSFQWFRAQDLLTQKTIYIPGPVLSLDTTQPRLVDSLFSASTNGLASGNTLAEATCHALLEIIERDCIARWQALEPTQQLETALDLTSISSPDIQTLIQTCHANDTQIILWDLTSPLGIPAYQCVITDNSLARSTNVFSGKGAHLSKDIALIRAITEAAQIRLTYIAGVRDDIFPAHYEHIVPPLKKFPMGKRSYHSTAPIKIPGTFEDMLQIILDRLRKHHFNSVVMYNHTRPDLNIPVVHALIPGMRAPHE